MGCWTPVIRTSLEANEKAALSAELISIDGSHFKVLENGNIVGEVKWSMTGQHSVANALATIAAASMWAFRLKRHVKLCLTLAV